MAARKQNYKASFCLRSYPIDKSNCRDYGTIDQANSYIFSMDWNFFSTALMSRLAEAWLRVRSDKEKASAGLAWVAMG